MQRRPSLVPDLYHVKRTTLSDTDIKTEICGTYTDYSAAQTAGNRRLLDEGHSKSTFAEYHENNEQEGWTYGPDVLVHARDGQSGDTFEVEIETTPNSLGVRAKPSGRVEDSLYYVVQTCKLGKVTKTAIRSIHLSRQAAVAAARHELLDHEVKKEWYSEYEEVAGTLDEGDGEQAIVRAVGPEGEKYIVSVLHET